MHLPVLHSSFLASSVISLAIAQHSRCWSNNSQLTTFDGLTFEKLASFCPQLAAADCTEDPSWYVYAYAPVRKPSSDVTILRYLSRDFIVDVIIYIGHVRVIIEGNLIWSSSHFLRKHKIIPWPRALPDASVQYQMATQGTRFS